MGATLFVQLLFILDLDLRRIFGQKKRRVAEYVKSVDHKCVGSYDQEVAFIPGVKFLLYILTHDERSYSIAVDWCKCMPWARVMNISSTKFFESIAYSEVFLKTTGEWLHLDRVGIATYKTLKYLPIEKLKAYIELSVAKPYDVVPLMPSGEYLMDQAVRNHGSEFEKLWYLLLTKLNFSPNHIKEAARIELFLRNTFIIKPKWLFGLSNFMNKAINLLLIDEELDRAFSSDAHYQEKKLDVARRIFSSDHYQWHPFIFERLPSFFFHVGNATTFTTLEETIKFENNIPNLFSGL